MGQLLDSVDDPLDMIELIPAESIPAQELQMPGSFGEQIGQPGLHLQVQPEPIDWIGPHGPHPEALIIEDPRKLRRQRLADCLRHPCRCLAFTLHDLLLPPNTRHRGIGKPLLRESWRYRPFHAGWFMGPLQGSPLIDDWVGGSNGFLAGYRFGWDYDHYWGCELRFAFGNVALYDSQRAKDAQTAADNANNIPVDDPFRDRFETRRDLTGSFWDVSILHYPWGDATWRPYFSVGLGTAKVRFIDRLSIQYADTVFAVPLAVGLKYRCNSWLALRVEFADEIVFGDDFDITHFLSVTGGMEVRFGGMRTAYWPWHPGRHYW